MLLGEKITNLELQMLADTRRRRRRRRRRRS
jgi:hypothetical protein